MWNILKKNCGKPTNKQFQKENELMQEAYYVWSSLRKWLSIWKKTIFFVYISFTMNELNTQHIDEYTQRNFDRIELKWKI